MLSPGESALHRGGTALNVYCVDSIFKPTNFQIYHSQYFAIPIQDTHFGPGSCSDLLVFEDLALSVFTKRPSFIQ